jgi:hypothetical protein
MNDVGTYLIRLCGQVDEGEINGMSPLPMTLVQADTAATLFTVVTDQSGLIGLMRHVHGLGLKLLSVWRVEPD